jgi:protein involved in polysaccharide export with SLBB domain
MLSAVFFLLPLIGFNPFQLKAQVSGLPGTGQIQIPVPQLSLLRSELSKRGITELEVKDYLLTKGVDVSKLSPAEILVRKEEIKGYILELEGEKKVLNNKKTEDFDLKDALKKFKEGELDTLELTPEEMELLRPQLEKVNELTEKEKKEKEEEELLKRKDEIYGHRIFESEDLKLFTTTEGAKAPESYIIAAGDELRITIFGLSQADILMQVRDEGFIQPSGLPKIYVQGLSLAEARKLVRQRFSAFYRFNTDEFALTIQKARTVTVNIFGEVKRQGSFSLSALNTAITAIAAAGGVTPLASVREIELIRGKMRKKIDLYAFLENPAIQADYNLQQNDIIFVPVANKVVALKGGVKRPMRYEVIDGDGLQKIIKIAGGPVSNASPDFVQIERNEGDSIRLLEYKLNEVIAGKFPVVLADGDTIRFRNVNKLLENYVEIEGAVFYPGRYDLGKNPTLRIFLEKAQVRPEAREEFVFIERPQRDSTFRTLRIDVRLEPQFKLEPRDRLILLEKSIFANMDSVAILGAVQKEITLKMSYEDEFFLRDLLLLAGGPKTSAADFGYIFRKSWYMPGKIEYIRVNVKDPGDAKVRAGDQLYVYERNNLEDRGQLSVSGAVNTPLNIPFDNKISLSDLLNMAGGFTERADKNRIDVFRLNYKDNLGTTFDKITLSLDTNFQIKTGSVGFQLQPYDQIAVREFAQFNPDRTVLITGQVNYPGLYSLKNNLVHLTDLIADAGGLTPIADRNNAILFRTRGEIGKVSINLGKAIQNPKSVLFDPVLTAGDSITIDEFNNTVAIRLEGTRLGDLVEKELVLDTLLEDKKDFYTFNYQGKHSARWYIQNNAGGFAQRSIRSSVTLTLPDGRVESTRRFLFLKDYPTVEAGSIISLSKKPEKIDEEGKKDFNLERVLSTTTQSISTLLTILLLLRQL